MEPCYVSNPKVDPAGRPLQLADRPGRDDILDFILGFGFRNLSISSAFPANIDHDRPR